MRSLLRSLPAFAFVAITLIGCKNGGPKLADHIAKESFYVVAINAKSMASKLEKDSLSMEQMLNVLKDDSSENDYARAMGMWNQFKDAGIDFDDRVFVSINSPSAAATTTRVQMLAGVKDAGKLEAFAKQMPGSPAITKQDDISIAKTANYTMGWDKKTVMVFVDAATPDMGNMDTTLTKMPGTTAISEAEVVKYFKMDDDASVNSLEIFTDLMKKEADVAVFTNSASITNMPGYNQAFVMMPKLKELLNGIYSTGTINFNDGKVEMESTAFAGDKLGTMLKKYAGPTVDMSLLNRHPSGNLQAVSAFSFNPALLPEFLKELGMDALVNMALAQGGSTMEELSKAFKGDFAVMVSDFGFKAIPGVSVPGATMPSANLIVAVRIGDKAAFDKLLALAQQTGAMKLEGKRIIPVADSMEVRNGVFAGIENDLLLISTDSALYQGYAAGTSGKALPDNVKKTMEGKSVGFYADAESVLKGLPATMFDSTRMHEKRILDQARQTFKYMWFNAGNFDGKKIEGEGELVMGSDKNSLSQLVRFLMTAAEEMKARQKADEAMYKKMESELTEAD